MKMCCKCKGRKDSYVALEKSKIDKVCETVYRKFPEVKGCRPKTQARPDGQYLLTYKGEVQLGSGKTMKRIVRAVVDKKGKVIKITTSR